MRMPAINKMQSLNQMVCLCLPIVPSICVHVQLYCNFVSWEPGPEALMMAELNDRSVV